MAERAHWKSRLGFVLAAAGSAVGLGNIWKFPYITGENGGGLFVLIYLLCILLVGLPIMMAEILIGRAAQKQPAGAFEVLEERKTAWSTIGWMGVLTGFIILSYYSVVAGWAMDYTLKSIINFTEPIHKQAEAEAIEYRATASLETLRDDLIDHDLDSAMRAEQAQLRRQVPASTWQAYDRFRLAIANADDRDVARERLLSDPEMRQAVEDSEKVENRITELRREKEEELTAKYESMSEPELLDAAETLKRRQVTYDKVSAAFGATAADGWGSAFWSLIFMVITIVIVAGGVSSGIERACQLLMPTLCGLILVMVLYGTTQPGFERAFAFVFSPDPTKLKASGVLEALGHAFFTLSLGMGAMITYGSYQDSKKGLLTESAMIALLDTLVALMACLMIFPIVFSYGQEPGEGPGLVFMSMPLAFTEIGAGGMVLAIVFFGLLVFAALTSAISLLEVVASYLIDQRDWSRPRAAWVTGIAIFLFGLPTAFSQGDSPLFPGWKPGYGVSFFDTMDILTSNWMLPLGGLLTAIYAGWVMPARLRDAEITDIPEIVKLGWIFMLRFITPALVVIVLLQKVGILKIDELLVW